MLERALVMFPQGQAIAAVERLRRQYDPQHDLIAAHVTLVFPFRTTISTQTLREHVTDAAAGAHPIAVRLELPTAWDGDYLTLDVHTGARELVTLHHRLYRGVLAAFLSPDHVYRPHVTIGCSASPDVQHQALAAVRAQLRPTNVRLDEIASFSLSERHIEFAVPLT